MVKWILFFIHYTSAYEMYITLLYARFSLKVFEYEMLGLVFTKTEFNASSPVFFQYFWAAVQADVSPAICSCFGVAPIRPTCASHVAWKRKCDLKNLIGIGRPDIRQKPNIRYLIKTNRSGQSPLINKRVNLFAKLFVRRHLLIKKACIH